MATVGNLLADKGAEDLTIGKQATVLEAAHLMNDHKVGALVVTEAGQVIGMFTERDVLRRVVGDERIPGQTRVEEVMTTQVACCTLETSLDEVRVAMKNRRIRHLPVVGEGGSLLGLVSIGDLNAHQATSQEQTIYLLHEYLYGRV